MDRMVAFIEANLEVTIVNEEESCNGAGVRDRMPFQISAPRTVTPRSHNQGQHHHETYCNEDAIETTIK